MNDEELLNLIKNEYKRIKPNNCWEFFKQRDRRIPCLQNLQKRFKGTYNDILIMAGISDDDLNCVRRDKEQYLKKLEEVCNKLGYIPSTNEFIQLGYTPQILAKYFGSYSEAVKEIKKGYVGYKTPVVVKETKEELLKMYIHYSNKIGKPASCTDLAKSKEIYNPGVFLIRFGSMKDLKEEAGFPPIITNKTEYTKKGIKNILKERYLEIGRRLTVEEIKLDNRLPAHATILRKFQTTKMEDIWKEIELSIWLTKKKIS